MCSPQTNPFTWYFRHGFLPIERMGPLRDFPWNTVSHFLSFLTFQSLLWFGFRIITGVIALGLFVTVSLLMRLLYLTLDMFGGSSMSNLLRRMSLKNGIELC